jgi:hypothetical protein
MNSAFGLRQITAGEILVDLDEGEGVVALSVDDEARYGLPTEPDGRRQAMGARDQYWPAAAPISPNGDRVDQTEFFDARDEFVDDALADGSESALDNDRCRLNFGDFVIVGGDILVHHGCLSGGGGAKRQTAETHHATNMDHPEPEAEGEDDVLDGDIMG